MKKGFTLVELLAVIVILAIILAIAIPGISSLINNTTKNSFESDAKLLLKQLEYEKLKNDNFDPTTTTIDTLSTFNLSNDNYTYLKVDNINNETYLFVAGQNKWDGLKACGTIKNMMVATINDTEKCATFNFNYTGDYQVFIVPTSGSYKFELWGAQGACSSGKGAYTKGTLSLTADQKLYVYVGQKKEIANTSSFNGGTGTYGGFPGGGATDIRLSQGDWNNVQGLRDRIMVAAGGGSGTSNGFAGALNGGNGQVATGGTQTTGGVQESPYGSGSFGIGGGGCGGGGGYYGGGGALCAHGGGGGSSFISGYSGCDAVNSSGTNTGQPNHYSGKVFTDSQIIAGNASMPSPSGSTEIGHIGSGYARITYLGD